jgi:methenyltetrahydromethanopterin cyclohydrolase
MTAADHISVNARAGAAVDTLRAASAELKIGVTRGMSGETVIDAGGRHAGSVAAGMRIAEICMGGLADVRLAASSATPRWPWAVQVHSAHPVVACLASQYAGWRLAHGEGKGAFFALGSGPARALARKEALFEELGYRDSADTATLVLEAPKPPPAEVVERIARDCGVSPDRLNIIFAATQSIAGGVQVVARVLEVALHKAHELKFPLERIVEGMGAAPLPPPHPDFVTAMGRTNDAIIYAGRVQLYVSGAAADARELAERLPSTGSRDYGRPFADVFRHYKGDFYAIDPMLFSPAQVVVTAIETGESFHVGHVNLDLLDASFT